jgi:hypothetical protein
MKNKKKPIFNIDYPVYLRGFSNNRWGENATAIIPQ